jgi:glycosyltransferase involved in cell wall biosynthesis
LIKVGTIYTLYGRRAGAELYFEKIVFGFSEKFQDVCFTIFCNHEAWSVLPDEMPNVKKVLIKELDRQEMKLIWLEFLSKRQIQHANLDLFWIPSGSNSFPGRWDIPTVVTFHDFGEYYIKQKYDLKRTLYRKLICIPCSLKRASSITSVSETTADDLMKLFRKSQRPKVIYSGPSPRSITLFNRHEDASELVRVECNVELTKVVFVPGRTDYVGKGLDIVLRAYKKFLELSGEHIPPKLVFVGPQGEGHGKFIKEMTEMFPCGEAIWLGRVSDKCVDALYSIAEMVIIPSRYEGFGFPILEAMLHLVPIVCSKAGALPEVAGKSAVYFDTDSVSSLCDSILSVHTNERLRISLIEEAKHQIKKFSWDTTIVSMREIFLQLLTNEQSNSINIHR